MAATWGCEHHHNFSMAKDNDLTQEIGVFLQVH